MIKDFFNKKKVLITGHTGFKGSWLTLFLYELGAEITGISLAPKTPKDFYVVNELDRICNSNIFDISDFNAVEKCFAKYEPDFIFHLAAQPLVRYSYSHSLETFQTNVMGTVNVLEAAKRINSRCAIVIITTDKVYRNEEWCYPYRETDPLGGKDPYSASKSCSEMVVSSYQHSFYNSENFEIHKKAIATARAGNVIGGGDWSVDRLMPDIIKSVENNSEIIIRNPDSVRPWQHVLEPLYGYLLLASKLYNMPEKYSEAWNFGPYPEEVIKVKDVVNRAIDFLEKGAIKVNKNKNGPYESSLLKLDISKAINKLDWKPRYNTSEAISHTLAWYKTFLDKRENIFEYSKQCIHDYLKLAEV